MLLSRICIVLLAKALLVYSTSFPPVFRSNLENEFNVIEAVLSVSDSISPTCKNHSLYYIHELKRFKLWALEMFDASTKFSSGNLFGSTYDLGAFDQCVGIKIPFENEEIRGQHCLAKFTLTPPKGFKKKKINFSADYSVYSNVSVWDKIFDSVDDPVKVPRNEFYFSYCIPSSCTNVDLKNFFKEIISITEFDEFSLSINVEKRLCQVKKDYDFTAGEIAFISFMVFSVLLMAVASFYDWLLVMRAAEEKNQTGLGHRVLLCFSFPRNLQKIVQDRKDDDGLNCISGIKSITMGSFIIGHGLMFVVGSPQYNPQMIEKLYSKVEGTTVLNGPIVVDTFFVISGFLTTYHLLCELQKRKSVNIFSVILHRFIRLTPSYMVMVAFYSTLFYKMGSGVFWEQKVGVEHERCQANWWTNLLYINNYVNSDQMCMFQSWYLPVDMHLFILTILIVMLLWERPTLCIVTIIVITILSLIGMFATVYIYDEDAILLLYVRFLKDIVVYSTYRIVYVPSHLRLTPYMIGILAGYIRYKIKKDNYKIPNYILYIGWTLCVVLIIVTWYTAFVFYIQEVDVIFRSFYASIHQFTWSLANAWLIVAISCGHGAYIVPFLSWNPWIILGRITYAAYLVHGAIQLFESSSMRFPRYYDFFPGASLAATQLFGSILLGFSLNIMFESPIIGLEKIIFGNRKRSSEEDEKMDQIREKKRATHIKADVFVPRF